MTRWRLLLAFGVAVCCTAHAEQHQHRVAPGDTLIDLARRYWGDPEYWRVIRRANPGIRDERRLQPGTVVLVPMPPAAGAVALHVSGKVTVTRLGVAMELVRDAEIRETDVLDVPPGAYVTLRWADGVISHLLPGTRLRIVPPAPEASASRARTLDLQGGNIESSVPGPRAAEHKYQIRTRVGVAAVRGTHFGVRFSPQGAMVTDVTEGEVALAGEGYRGIELPAGTGARTDASRRQPVAAVMLPPPALDDPLVLMPESAVRGSAVEKAVAYEMEVATESEPPATLQRRSGGGPVFTLPLLADGTYRLTLRAVDAQGIPGRPATRSLTIVSLPSPFLSEPANDSVLAQDLPGRLSCSDVPHGTGYEFEIVRLDAAEQPRRLEAAGACEVILPVLTLGRYEWRARAMRGIAPGRALRGAWSAPARFTVAARPATPALSVRGAGQALRLMWEGVPEARYVVQLAHDMEFRSIVRETRVDAPEVTLQVPTGEAYYVRIRTLSAAGLASDFSQARIVRGPFWLGTTDGSAVRDSVGTPLAPSR